MLFVFPLFYLGIGSQKKPVELKIYFLNHLNIGMVPLVVSRIMLVQNLVLKYACMTIHQLFLHLFSVINLSGGTQPIEVMIGDNRRKTISDNRKKLIPIVDIIITCGHLGLSFRGHRDDSRCHPEVGSYCDGGVGNFIELLNMRVREGEVALGEHLKTCPKNASYISKTSQNELIKCCGQVTTEAIITEVKQNTFFTIIADGAVDCSNKEQMSLVLRFVGNELNIR